MNNYWVSSYSQYQSTTGDVGCNDAVVGESVYSRDWETRFTLIVVQSASINVHSYLSLCQGRCSYASPGHNGLRRCSFCRQRVELVVADCTTSPRLCRRVLCDGASL